MFNKLFKMVFKINNRIYKDFKHSCWECQYSIGHRSKGYHQTFWDPGEGPSIEGCDADMSEGYYESLMKNTNEQEDIDEYLGNKCKYFIAEVYSCAVCNKAFSAGKGYEVSDDYESIHVCSKTCGRIELKRIDKYYANEKQMEEEYAFYLEEERKRKPTIEEERALDDYISSGRADEDYDRYKYHNQRVLRRNNL